MNCKASWHWLKFVLVVVLMFGGGLPTAFAQIQEINGIEAAVEDETGAPLTNARVVLYEYQYIYLNGGGEKPYYYANQTFSAPLTNGKFFIPNAYLLKGKLYDLVVKGISSSSQREIVYHYSFTGGDISALQFSKDQLKELTFTHGQTGTQGQFVLVARDALGNTSPSYSPYYYSYPYFNTEFGQNNSVKVLMASNVEVEAYASLSNSTEGKNYALQQLISPQTPSGQTFRMDSDLVKVSYPAGYADGAVGISTNVLQFPMLKEAYASRGFKGNVYFGVQEGDWRYAFNRNEVTIDQDMVLPLGKELTGSARVQMMWNYNTSKYENTFFVNYKDTFGNVLGGVWNANQATVPAMNTELLVKSVDANGNSTRTTLSGVNQPLETGALAELPPGTGNFEYELYNSQGTLVKQISTNDTFMIPFGDVAPGTYRLKLAKQAFPAESFHLTLDQTIMLSNPNGQTASWKNLQFEMPQGYTAKYLRNVLLWSVNQKMPMRTNLYSGGLPYTFVGIDPKELVQDQEYLLLAQMVVSDPNGMEVSYLLKQRFTGKQLLDMQVVPLQQKLVKTEISAKGTAVGTNGVFGVSWGDEASNIKLNSAISFNSQLTAPAAGYLLSEPGSYKLSLTGSNNPEPGVENVGYYFAKSVNIPDQQQLFTVNFEDVKDQLVGVEIKNNADNVPFTDFYVKGVDHHFWGTAYIHFYNQAVTKLYTMPGNYSFGFIMRQTKANETPWLYYLESEYQTVQSNITLSINGIFDNPVFGPIQEHTYSGGEVAGPQDPNGNTKIAGTGLSTSVLMKNGDFRLIAPVVYRDNGYKIQSEAIEVTRPYDGIFDRYTNVNGTFTLTDESGKDVFITTVYDLNQIYANTTGLSGVYQMKFTMPIGPKEAINITQPVTIGHDPNTPPGKPQPQAVFAGQGLKLTWSPTAGAAYYQVFAAESGTPLVKVADSVKETAFAYTAAQSGKKYDLKVVALTSKGVATESDIITFEMPQFAVSKLTVDTKVIESAAGLLKLGTKLPIKLEGTMGSGITGKASVSYKKKGSSVTLTEEIELVPGTSNYTGEFEIKTDMTEIIQVKAFLTKDGGSIKTAELSTEALNKFVGATVKGILTRGGAAITSKPTVRLVVGNQYVSSTADANGIFSLAGVPQGTGNLSVVNQEEYELNVVKNIVTEYGTSKDIGAVVLPVYQNVKIQLLEEGTNQPVTKPLQVSISGPANKEGYIGQDGFFVTYSGESEMKRLKSGTYSISVKGSGMYNGLAQQVSINESTNYVENPILVYVSKKAKETANVTVELFIPDGTSAEKVESYYLQSKSVLDAFGWEEGYRYGYNQPLTVSERVYMPNPQHVSGGSTSTTVAEQVYGRIGTFTIPSLVIANDYSLNLRVEGFQSVNKTQAAVSLADPKLKVELKAAVAYTGRIVDKNGKPVADADVSAYSGSSYVYARTDADGRYRLHGLAESSQLYMHVKAVGYVNYDNLVQTANSLQVPDIALENDQFIHGKVVDKNNKPLKHASVFAAKLGDGNSGWARTDADGYFKIRGLSAGTYSLNASLYGYPSYTGNYAASADEVTLVLQQEQGAFSGEGNSFASSVTTVVYGKEMTYRLNYKNNSGTDTGNAVWNFTLPASVKLVEGSVELNGKAAAVVNGIDLQVPVGSVATGAEGSISFKVQVVKADEAAIRSSAYATVGADKASPTLTSTTSVLYVTLNAPAVTGEKKIKVYGSTKPSSTVEIFAGSTSLGRVTAEGRWWYADVVLPVADNEIEADFQLTARVIGDEASLNPVSETVPVKYLADVPGLVDVTITAGWNKNVKLNPNVSVAAFAITEKTPIQTKVTFKQPVDEAFVSFIGSDYPLSKGEDGKIFEGQIPYGWSSYGEQLLTLTYKKNGISITVPLMEVIVLIDPSGYVFEGSMENRLSGVTAVIQQFNEGTGKWSNWDAQNYGQVTPQTTDEQGRYAWDVVNGKWRVLFSKQGYEDYISRTVVVPPAETELNVPLVRTSQPLVETVTPADQATKVGSQPDIEIDFDRPMNQAGMDTKIRLVPMQGNVEGTPVDVTFTYENLKGYAENKKAGSAGLEDGNGESGWFEADLNKLLSKKLILKPKTALAANTTYRVIIDKELMDYSGKELKAGSSTTFTTAQAGEAPKSPGFGGGGGLIAPAAGNTVELDNSTLAKALTNNEVRIAFTEEQDTLSVKGSVWKIIQSKGYTVKLQHKEAAVTIPARSFSLQDNETLKLELKSSDSAYPQGYAAASSVLRVTVTKQKDGKVEGLNASEPLVLTLAASPTNEPTLIGAYAFVNGQPEYLGRALNVEFLGSGTFGLAQFERSFNDVEGHWAKQDIRYLVSHHIVDGATETSFDPVGTTTRGQIAKLLAELLQLTKTDAKPSFMDVPADAWYAGYIAAVEKAGIFQGADGQFRPDAAISRQELAIVISRLVKQQAAANDRAFADQSQIAAWAQNGVGVAVKLGIIQGDEANRFQPEANATRAEAAAMIHRLIQALDKQDK